MQISWSWLLPLSMEPGLLRVPWGADPEAIAADPTGLQEAPRCGEACSGLVGALDSGATGIGILT